MRRLFHPGGGSTNGTGEGNCDDHYSKTIAGNFVCEGFRILYYVMPPGWESTAVLAALMSWCALAFQEENAGVFDVPFLGSAVTVRPIRLGVHE